MSRCPVTEPGSSRCVRGKGHRGEHRDKNDAETERIRTLVQQSRAKGSGACDTGLSGQPCRGCPDCKIGPAVDLMNELLQPREPESE